MRIAQKIHLDFDGLIEHGPITIAAFGDSVTHGAAAFDEINYETVYWNRLRKKILQVKNYVPVNVINAGIGGDTAQNALQRMEKQVFAHNPDLIIVCFGLNDVNGELEDYISALKTIFARCKETGEEALFMTPNMLNTYVAEDTPEAYREYAAVTAQMQTSGRMDRYMEAACRQALLMDIPVCDCYAQWKELSKTRDVTMLLANRINHPAKEMHELFAESLFQAIFRDAPGGEGQTQSTMWKEASHQNES